MTRRILLQSAILLALTAAAGALTWHFHPERPELYLVAEPAPEGEISLADALERQKKDGVVWLDARQESEFRKGHIPGAILLNEYDWENLLVNSFEKITQAPDQSPAIVYCDGQKCAASHAVRKRLEESKAIGDREILVLHGGFPAWVAGEYPVEKP
jgi:rhodanese-related sulfurtransferase